MTNPADRQSGLIALARDMREFVGLADSDVALIRASRDMVLSHADALTSALYDHLLRWPATAAFFTVEGQPDAPHLAERRHTLAAWLSGLSECRFDDPAYWDATRRASAAHRGAGVRRTDVPARYVFGTMAFIQSAICEVLFSSIDDREQAVRAAGAWSKLLYLALFVLLQE